MCTDQYHHHAVTDHVFCMHLKNKKNNKYSIEFMLLTIYLCCSNEIGDKYHYVMSCGALKEERKKLLPHYCTFNPNFHNY